MPQKTKQAAVTFSNPFDRNRTDQMDTAFGDSKRKTVAVEGRWRRGGVEAWQGQGHVVGGFCELFAFGLASKTWLFIMLKNHIKRQTQIF